jgi:Right handed beta helix region
MKKHLAYSLLAAGLALLTVASNGQTVINSVPFTISTPGKYVLGRDLSFGGGTAIMVQSPIVTIDFNGFTLEASSIINQDTAIGCESQSQVTIENGTISGFFNGIRIAHSARITLQNLHLLQINGAGIKLISCQDSVISNCEVSRIGAIGGVFGTEGILLNHGFGNRVMIDTVSGYNFGILSEGQPDAGNYFENDYIANSNNGISMRSNDKYRAITTTNIRFVPIQGGIDVGTSSQ